MKTTALEVAEMIAKKESLNIIDVRGVDEVRNGKIPGAINIPLGLLEARMNELDKKKEYIIVCQSGGRSGQATNFLENWGYQAVNMADGMQAWEGPIQ